MTGTPALGPERYWAMGLDALFPPGHAPTTVVPWPGQHRRRDLREHDQTVVTVCLTNPPQLDEVDPRQLWATQPGLTHAGVDYYVHDQRYLRLGRTYADRDKVGNAFPLIYRRAGGQNLILAGHHRSAAALVKGEFVRALVTEGPWGGLRSEGLK